MSKEWDDCAVCGAENAYVLWTPFESIMMTADVRHAKLKLESIVICGLCKSRVYKMYRSDGHVFDGCQTIEDIVNTVREGSKK